jgi:hypothetical protein
MWSRNDAVLKLQTEALRTCPVMRVRHKAFDDARASILVTDISNE